MVKLTADERVTMANMTTDDRVMCVYFTVLGFWSPGVRDIIQRKTGNTNITDDIVEAYVDQEMRFEPDHYQYFVGKSGQPLYDKDQYTFHHFNIGNWMRKQLSMGSEKDWDRFKSVTAITKEEKRDNVISKSSPILVPEADYSLSTLQAASTVLSTWTTIHRKLQSRELGRALTVRL